MSSTATVRDAAVVDVGSSSVRLVLYRIEGRSLHVLHNERAVVGLGRSVASTGRLDPDAAARAQTELARFRALTRTRGVRDVIAVATAAVREAEDGEAFARVAGRILNTKLRILTGTEEGQYAGYGVIAAEPNARGVVGDLGGSSLEIAHVDGASDMATGAVTLPLGPLAIADVLKKGRDAARAVVDAAIDQAGVKTDADTFYLVGGAWRNIARMHMADVEFPIRAVHAYELTAREMRDYAREISRMTAADVAERPEVSGRRVETLPAAALVLDRLVKRLSVERVVVSGYGLREGLLFDRMPPPEKRSDPLLAGVEMLARSAGAEPGFWMSLQRWLAPLSDALGEAFGAERDRVLHAAACRLADAGERIDPVDRGAPLTFNHFLHIAVVAISHPERAFLALALHHRHSGKRLPPASAPALELLTKGQRAAAMALGLSLRLACDLSARSAALLDLTSLRVSGRVIELAVQREGQALANETVRRRLAQLADAVGLESAVVHA